MKRFFLYIIFSCVVFNCLSIQFSGKTGAQDLHERIYVQTDKQIYLAGEPVLLKLSTTDDKSIPLVFSKTGYAELVRDSLALAQIKVELIDGTGSGQMLLPVDLPTGYYRLIAYTQFMRNEGHKIFFEKNIAVINTFQSGYQFSEVEREIDHPVSTHGETGTISLKLDKASYTTREHGELIITGLPENIYTLSASIAGKEVTITEELPEESSSETKELSEQTEKFLPEYEGHIITGKIIDNETGNPVTNDIIETGAIAIYPVIGFPGNNIWFFSGTVSETENNVRFFTSGNPGMKEIASVVYNAGNQFRVDIQSPFVNRYEPKEMPVLRIDPSCYNQLLSRSVALQVFRYFSKDPSEIPNVSQPYMKMKPSSVYRLDEYTRYPTMSEVIVEIVANVRFHKVSGKQELTALVKRGLYFYFGYPLVILDGVPIADHDSIYNYDPLLVERINVYADSYALGLFAFDGIIEFKTYQGSHEKFNLNESSQIVTYETPQPPFHLDTPDYSYEENRHSLMPDSRHTLLWNPDVRSGGNTSVKLPFDTSDLTGEFKVTVEGKTKEGKNIFANSFFKVE